MIFLKNFASLFLPVTLLFCSCKHSGTSVQSQRSDFDELKKGMSYIEVIEAAGLPDRKVDVGVVTDESGLEIKSEEWYYGDNHLVVIVNDTVNAIDTDLQGTYRKIQHIIDSARAAGDTSAMIEPIRKF